MSHSTLMDRRRSLTYAARQATAAGNSAEAGRIQIQLNAVNRDIAQWEERFRSGNLPAPRPVSPARRSLAELRQELTAMAGLGSRHAAPPRDGFASMGEFLHAVRFNPGDRRLSYVHADPGQRAEMRMDDGASGGFAVPPQFLQELRSVAPQGAIVRPRAQVLPAGSPPDAAVTMPILDQTGAAPGNMHGGVQVQWIGEGAPKPETDMKLRELTLTPHEVAGTITVTDKLLRNWQAGQVAIEAQFRGALIATEDMAFIRGNGIAKPLGYLASPALLRVPRLAAGTVTYDDVVNMVTRLHGTGVFLYSRGMMGALMRLKDGQGRPIWIESAREGEPSTLLGRPAIESDRLPALGQLGDLSLVDLSYYLIKDGSGPFVAASPHVKFAENKTVIKIFWNVDGAPWLSAPLRTEGGDLVSPFVALDLPSI